MGNIAKGRFIKQYWESWEVAAGAHVADTSHDAYSDEWHGKGIHFNGSARFYEGITLSPLFQVGNVKEVGGRSSTENDPHMSLKKRNRPGK